MHAAACSLYVYTTISMMETHLLATLAAQIYFPPSASTKSNFSPSRHKVVSCYCSCIPNMDVFLKQLLRSGLFEHKFTIFMAFYDHLTTFETKVISIYMISQGILVPCCLSTRA